MEDNTRVMKFNNDRLKYLSLLLLPAIIWFVTNATINTHTHTLEYGVKIIHAHPFDKNTGKTNSFPNHKHTRGELNLLNLISHPLTLLAFAVIIFVSSNISEIIFPPYILQFFSWEHYYVFNYHAPPVSFQ